MLNKETNPRAYKYHCPLGLHYFLQAPFPIYIMEGQSCVRVIDSDGKEGRKILLNGEGVTYLGITDSNGTEVKNKDILTVLNSLKTLFTANPAMEHLVEPVEWHIRNFEAV